MQFYALASVLAILTSTVAPTAAVARQPRVPVPQGNTRVVPADHSPDTLALVGAASADTLTSRRAAGVYPGRRGDLDVELPELQHPDIQVDGVLNEPAWSRAAELTDFTQYDPIEGVPARARTVAYIFYTPEALYVAAKAYDPDPSKVRATMAQRDKIGRSDDWIRVTLDTYDDAQRAFVFTVNPLGVQQDGLWIEGYHGGHGPPIDHSPDFLWTSAGRRTSFGYVVEMRIPLKSLRFPDASRQVWGINIARRVQRTGYQSSWAPITKDRSNQLAQSGKLMGISGIHRGLFLEMNPTLTTRVVGQYNDSTERFVRGHADPQFGFNTAYGVTPTLTLNATYNPDFSQVEADAGKIAVNQRYALFFPEKRPFFLEGTEIFQMPQRLVYTRRIGNPIGGAKLTGKLGAEKVGYIGALDRPVEGHDALFNVVRVKRDIGQGYAGLLYTDRTVTGGPGFNRVAGADTRLLFGGRYTLQLLGAGAWNRDTTSSAATQAGSLIYADLERSGRTLSFQAEFTDISPNFNTASGFIRRTDMAQIQGHVSLRAYGQPGDLIEDWGPQLSFHRIWAHRAFWQGRPADEGQLQLEMSASIRGNNYINVGVQRGFFDYSSADYAGLYVLQNAADSTFAPYVPARTQFNGLWGVQLHFFANGLGWLRGGFHADWKQQPIFAPGSAAEARPAIEMASDYSVGVNATLQPTRSATLDLSLQQETLYRERDGHRYSSAVIPRLQAQYQFTRALFFRLIGQYSAQDTYGLFDPATGAVLAGCDSGDCSVIGPDPSNQFHVETLLAYEPSPGTVFYAGYSRDMIENNAFAFDGLQPRLDGLFVKFSYRYRL